MLSINRTDAHRDLHYFPTRRSSDLPRFSGTTSTVGGITCASMADEAPSTPKPLRSCGFPSTARLRLRSEEHTSELQSRGHLVCRLLLEKKNNSPHIQ